MRKLKEYASESQKSKGRLFEGQFYVAYFQRPLREYARKARIKDWRLLKTERLRNTLSPLEASLARFGQDIASQAQRMSYFYALNYSLERSIRLFVSKTLKDKYDGQWFDKVPPEVQKYIKERQEEERGSPKEVRSGFPLDYTTFPQLRLIIEANWDDFRDRILRGGLEDVSRILLELGYGRLLIAHSCELPQDEKKRFEVGLNDWLRVLGS